MKLRELVDDVHYFIRDFSWIANQAPLQLYASALAFAPEASKVKSFFNNCIPRWLVLPPKVADVWGMNSLVLEGHLGFTDGLSFSTCGTYLATCAQRDGALRVWHSSTGNCTLDIPRPGRMLPVTVSFSHDAKHLAEANLGSHYSQEDVSLSAIVYDMVTGNAIDTYVWTTPKRPGLLDVRLVFAHESSNELFVAIANGGFLEVWRKRSTLVRSKSMGSPNFNPGARTLHHLGKQLARSMLLARRPEHHLSAARVRGQRQLAQYRCGCKPLRELP